jgi:hypothetical protein
MIISGGSRCDWKYWAKHLTKNEENERVHIAEIKGLASHTVHDALHEMSLLALGSRAVNFIYHADINPREEERLSPEEWDEAVDRLERNLGLEGHSRIVVEHEKEGRVHRHVVWNRIDPDRMTVVSDYRDWIKHQATSRELEAAFGLEPVNGVIGPDGKRVKRRAKNYETRRGKETGLTPEQVGAELTAAWTLADTGKAFAAAIDERGYVLAKGDGRDFVVIAPDGTTHSLARRIDGAKAADVRKRMKDVDRDSLPDVDAARAQVKAQAAQAKEADKEKKAAEVTPAGELLAEVVHEVLREKADPVPDNGKAAPGGFFDAVKETLFGRGGNDPTVAEEAAAQPSPLDRFEQDMRAATGAWTPPVPDGATPLERYERDVKRAMAANGGELATVDGKRMWQRAATMLAYAAEQARWAATHVKDAFRSFAERVGRGPSRPRDPGDRGLDR